MFIQLRSVLMARGWGVEVVTLSICGTCGRVEELITIKRYNNYFYSVAFSPDGKMLASGSQDTNIENATIILWDVASGQELKTLKGHSSYVSSVVFSPDGKTLASGSGDSFDQAMGCSFRTRSENSQGTFKCCCKCEVQSRR